MQCLITINMDNAAFEDKKLFHINGNAVGSIKVED